MFRVLISVLMFTKMFREKIHKREILVSSITYRLLLKNLFDLYQKCLPQMLYLSLPTIRSFSNIESLLFTLKLYVSKRPTSHAYTYLFPTISSEENKKINSSNSPTRNSSTLTDFRETGEEDPYPDDERRLDARKFDADDVILWLRRLLNALIQRRVSGRGGELLRSLGMLRGVIAAGRREAAQGGVIRQDRADDRTHGPKAQAGIRAVGVAGKVAGVDLRPGVLLRRDSLRGSVLVETRERSAAASRTAEHGDEERRDDHRGEAHVVSCGKSTDRRRRRRCSCCGRLLASSSVFVRRR